MIYLNPAKASALGEDTFWTWMKREVPDSSFGVPSSIENDDVILHYSVKGPSPHPGNTICLLWELYPEMAKAMGSRRKYARQIAKIESSAASARALTVSSPCMREFYEHHGKGIDVLPIAVDTELFSPLDNKKELRDKFDIPNDRKVVFWGGNTRGFKGPDQLQEWMRNNPDVHVIAVWTYRRFSASLEGASNFVQVSQAQLVELMNCADAFLCTNILRPYYMIEWEAMACGLPFIFTNDVQRDFLPGDSPREAMMKMNWDRASAIQIWLDYIGEFRKKIASGHEPPPEKKAREPQKSAQIRSSFGYSNDWDY
jgi:glycosyltransferase involved in cell wall biosynthesis